MPSPMTQAGSGRQALARVIYEAGTLIARYPALALSVARWRRHGEPVGPDTALVIEGYPRSANSFAVAVFAVAQPGPVRIAHHVHAPAHVIEALRRHVPVLVLVRDPEEAVVEFVLLKPALTVTQALRGWVRFYSPLVRYRHRFVAATTREVLADPGAVIRAVNERFGTSFRESGAGAETVARGVRAYWADRAGPGLPLVGRTSETEVGREADRERLRLTYRSARLARLRARAERLHRAITGAAG